MNETNTRPGPQPTPDAASADGRSATVAGGAADEAADPLLDCLVFLTRFYQRPFSAAVLRAGLPVVSGDRITPTLFVRAATRAGLVARVVRRPLRSLGEMDLPVVAVLDGDQAAVVVERTGDGFTVMLPEAGRRRRPRLAGTARGDVSRGHRAGPGDHRCPGRRRGRSFFCRRISFAGRRRARGGRTLSPRRRDRRRDFPSVRLRPCRTGALGGVTPIRQGAAGALGPMRCRGRRARPCACGAESAADSAGRRSSPPGNPGIAGIRSG